MVCITDSGSPPHVFTIPPHLAFRHATVTQWCCVTGQAGHWLFVSIQINHSLFWTDNVINVQKGHGVYSSQASCGVQGGQHSKWTPLKDCVLYLIDTVGSWVTWICIPECSFYLWWIKWLAVVILSETSFFSRFSSEWACTKSVKPLCRIDWYSTGQDKPTHALHSTGLLFSNDTCKYGPLLTLL